MDTANCIADVAYRLGYKNLADLQSTTSWVTQTELYQWADECAQRLAYDVGMFIVWDGSIAVAQNTALYALPATHVFTILAALQYLLGGSSALSGLWGTGLLGTQPFGPSGVIAPAEVLYQLLRITRAADLWSLDGNWPTTSGNSVRASFDAGSVGTITLYPIPIDVSTLVQVCQEIPPTISIGSSLVAAPTVMQDAFSYFLLGQARGKESEMADGAIAAHYMQRFEMYLKVAKHLYGAGQ